MKKIAIPGTSINIPVPDGKHLGKLAVTLAVLETLSWNVKAANLDGNINSQLLNDKKHRIEVGLQTVLADDKATFKYWNETSQEGVGNIEDKEKEAIDFIHENFSINWESAKNLTVERVWDDEYSIDYPLNLQWDTITWNNNTLLKVVVKCNYSETHIGFDKNVKFYIVFEKPGNTIQYDETMGQAKLDELAEKFKINGVYVNGKEKNGVKKYVKARAYWNKIYFDYDGDIYVYEKDWDSNGSVSNYKFIEKLYNVSSNKRVDWLWYDVDFAINNNPYVNRISIKENPYKNENIVKDVIAKYAPKYKDSFKDSYPEIWNIGLNKLNRPDLLEHIFKEDDWSYYRELCYKYGNEYIKIMNVYFDKTGQVNVEKTNNSMEGFGIIEKWDYFIDENWFFTFKEDAVKKIVEKVTKNRAVSVHTIKTKNVMSTNRFPNLKKVTIGEYYGPDPQKVISYIPYKDLFNYKLNAQEPVHCFIEDSTPVICDMDRNVTNQHFYNDWEPIRVIIKNWQLAQQTIDKPGENPQRTLPKYSGDKNISSLLNLLNDPWISVKIESDGVSYYKDWKFIWKIPCKKEKDGTRKMLENYSTNIDIMDLYNDSSFDTERGEIQDLCKKLWITEIDLIRIFEKSLKNKGLKFTSKNVRLINDGSKYWIYCIISNGFNVSKDNNVYNILWESFNEIKSRLEYLDKINNCKVSRVFWKQIEDFEDFTWIRSRDFVSQSAIPSFVSWDISEIKRKLVRWDWQEAIFNYSVVDGNILKWWLTWEWKTYFSEQWYRISIDKDWNIIFTVQPSKKNNK